MTFSEYILENKKSKFSTYQSDKQFISDYFGYNDKSNMHNAVSINREKYSKLLKSHGIEKNDMALKDMIDTCNQNNWFPPKRKIDWQNHEKDIAKGLNALFQNGFFIKNGEKIEDKENAEYIAEVVGGSKNSDVCVKHVCQQNSKEFYVECKLDFNTARYFKFVLSANKNGLKYDHKMFLQGKTKENKEEFDKINDLFKSINLTSFLTNLVRNKQISEYWKEFAENIDNIKDFILTDKQFKQFSQNVHLGDNFPQDFKGITKVFDQYLQHYIEYYNRLISQLFEYISDLSIRKIKDQFMIQFRHNEDGIENGTVFKSVDNLIDTFNNINQITDKDKFMSIVNAIKKIELKFAAIIDAEKLSESNVNKLFEIEESRKLKYFFKAFISSTGRSGKKTKSHIISQFESNLGTMAICPNIQIEDKYLSQMITKYYSTKDNCAYIQIGDTILQFTDKNPLCIPNLPMFSDVVTKFNVSVTIDDNLKNLHLGISAIGFNKDKLNSKNIVSFKESDLNYVSKKLESIDISQ